MGKASHPVKIDINDVAHAMTHHRSDAHASACQKVLRSDSRHALVTSRSVRYVFSYVFSKVHSTLRWYVSMKPCWPVFNNRRPHWSSDLLPQFCDACMTFAHLYVLCLTHLCRCIPFGQSEPAGQSETQL